MAQDDFKEFVERVRQAESRGQRYGKDGKLLTSPKGAQGEMQVMPATQRRPGFGITPIRDDSPDEIARVGRDLLKALDGYYGGNKMYAAAAYNWGKSNVDKWIAKGADFNQLPKETQGYLQRIKPETLPSMTARSAPPPAQEVGPAVMEPPPGISASAAPVTPARSAATSVAPAVATAPAARAEDLGSGYKAALALSFLGSEDKDRPTSDSELEDRLNETALAEFNKELEDYTPKNALADMELTALNPAKFMQPVKMADGGEVDPEGMSFSKGNTPTGNSAPPRFAAQELEAFIKAANPGATVLEYERGPGDALGFVHSKMPDVLNIKRSQTPGTKEQTTLHELEHSLDSRGGDILGRPDIAGMDNNFRAYHLMNNDWRPIESFVSSVIQNKDKLRDFFGQDIVSGYITMDPETFKKLKIRDKDRALFAEQIASLSALEQATGKSLTRDPEMRKIFPNTQMMAVYDALTGLRQTRTDARDLPPHTPLPSYMYETNPVTRFIREKTTGPNEYGIPIKRAGGSPETGEVALTPEEIAEASRPATFNRNIARQGTAARNLAAMRDVNTLPDPRTYAAVSGFLGEAPDQMGFSVMHPDIQGIKRAGEIGFATGLVPAVAPVVAPIARAAGRAATALGMRAEKALDAPVTRTLEGGGRSADMLKALGAQPSFAVPPSQPIFQHIPTKEAPFVGRLDEFVANMSAPVQKEQFLGMLKGKFRDYDIQRAQEALSDFSPNTKLAPQDLLARIKSIYDPGRFNTSVAPPGKYGFNYASVDNIYLGKPLGVIHLAQEVPAETKALQSAADQMLTTLERVRQSADNGVFSSSSNRNLKQLATNPAVPVSDEVRQRISALVDIYPAAANDVNSLRSIQTLLINTEASPDFMPAVKKSAEALKRSFPDLSDLQRQYMAMPTIAEQLYQKGYKNLLDLSKKYGIDVPAEDLLVKKPDFDSRLVGSYYDSSLTYSTPGTVSPEAKFIHDVTNTQLQLIQRKIAQPFNDAVNFAKVEVEHMLPYTGQHSNLAGSPLNPVAFSRFSEHTTDIPGMGRVNGIYVNELQSDLLEHLQVFGARGGSLKKDRGILKDLNNQIGEINKKTRDASDAGNDALVNSLLAERTSLMSKADSLLRRIQSASTGEGSINPRFPDFYHTQQPFANTERSPQALQQLMAKNAVVGAIQQGKQFVAFPGKESAQAQLYEKLPNNLKQVVKDLGPGFELRDVTLTTSVGDPILHRAVVWGPEAAARVQKKGVPFKSGGMVERTYNDNLAYL